MFRELNAKFPQCYGAIVAGVLDSLDYAERIAYLPNRDAILNRHNFVAVHRIAGDVVERVAAPGDVKPVGHE